MTRWTWRIQRASSFKTHDGRAAWQSLLPHRRLPDRTETVSCTPGFWNHLAWSSSVEFHLFLQGPLAHTCPKCPVLFKGHNNWFLRQMAWATATAQTAWDLLKVNIAWNWALFVTHCTKLSRQFHTLVLIKVLYICAIHVYYNLYMQIPWKGFCTIKKNTATLLDATHFLQHRQNNISEK